MPSVGWVAYVVRYADKSIVLRNVMPPLIVVMATFVQNKKARVVLPVYPLVAMIVNVLSEKHVVYKEYVL